VHLRLLSTFAVLVLWSGLAFGQASAIPQLNSRPGAAYTLYLNFGGFNYNGTWFGDTPGVTPAYDTNNNAAVFTTTELNNIRNIWSRSAEKYSVFNVNVTTVDPAVAAGQSATDALRQSYYDSRPGMMHMVIGGDGGWYGGSGIVGVSGGSVAETAQTGGLHTNWTFSSNYVSGGNPFLHGIAETIAHENGHALKLDHQSLWSGSNLVEEYDPGTASRAPIMGNSDGGARGLWRRGTSINGPTSIQNDVALLLTNAGIAGNGVAGFMDSGIGHTRQTATALPLTGNTIDSSTAKGIITPNSATDPNPLGEANYTTDFFTFTIGAGGANINITLRSGLSTITAGTADPGAILDATLRLLDSQGNVLSTANSGTLAETISQNNLAAGLYYLQISSAGADSQYFDLGSYFLTGTIIPVPEPRTVLLIGFLFSAAFVGIQRLKS
jgi:hypothetical protein